VGALLGGGGGDVSHRSSFSIAAKKGQTTYNQKQRFVGRYVTVTSGAHFPHQFALASHANHSRRACVLQEVLTRGGRDQQQLRHLAEDQIACVVICSQLHVPISRCMRPCIARRRCIITHSAVDRFRGRSIRCTCFLADPVESLVARLTDNT
jgi:hypothetical protein